MSRCRKLDAGFVLFKSDCRGSWRVWEVAGRSRCSLLLISLLLLKAESGRRRLAPAPGSSRTQPLAIGCPRMSVSRSPHPAALPSAAGTSWTKVCATLLGRSKLGSSARRSPRSWRETANMKLCRTFLGSYHWLVLTLQGANLKDERLCLGTCVSFGLRLVYTRIFPFLTHNAPNTSYAEVIRLCSVK